MGHEVVGASTSQADITSRDAVLALLRAVRPDAVINTAARMDSWPVCADGAGHVAVAAAEVGARLVHLSSDVVHGGRPEPYVEADTPTPLGAYGSAKAAGETAVAGPQAMSRADLGRLVARRYDLDPATVPTGKVADAGLGPRAAEVRLSIRRAYDLLTTTRIRPASESVRKPGH